MSKAHVNFGFCGGLVPLALLLISLACCGCNNVAGYSNDSLFPQNVRTVYVEMFDNRTFRRGTEYDLSDALAKRIEADTPYKIVSSRDRADSVIGGYILGVSEAVLSVDRQYGTVLEKELIVAALVNWKNLNTGELIIEGQNVSGSASYSGYLNQGFKYASTVAANNLAQRIVELMETKW